jgi:hypothetical protein
MAIRMLEDLYQFLMLASLIVVGFACAFFVLLSHERAEGLRDGTIIVHDDEAAGVGIFDVLGWLVESAMKGEPDHIMERSETKFTFSWFFMFLFGVLVVLLLLNLLIARFAKTFDMVYENVDANFKVAFARVVVEGRKKELLPPPLNLVSATINLLYDVMQRSCAYDLCRCCEGVRWPLRWALCGQCSGGDDEEERHRRLIEDGEREAESAPTAEAAAASSGEAGGGSEHAGSGGYGGDALGGDRTTVVLKRRLSDVLNLEEDDKWVAVEVRN